MVRFQNFILFILVGILGGCAGPSEVNQMIVQEKKNYPNRSVFFHNLSIGNVSVRDEYSSLSSSKVSPEVLRAALEASLQNNYFLATNGQPHYKIDATLSLARQFNTGSEASVSIFITYKISKWNRESEENILEETILSVETKPASGGFVSTLPVKAATEGAIKKNIEMLIQRLSGIAH